jgi:hypothetical protein
MDDQPVTSRLQVTAATVQRGDIIAVGGQPLQVADMVTVPGGGKRLVFVTGETLTLTQHTQLRVARLVPPPPGAIYAARRAVLHRPAR